MMLGDDDGGEELHVSIPRGGPIYVPNMLSPITRVPDFETSVCNELGSLEAELASDTLEGCEEIMLLNVAFMLRYHYITNFYVMAAQSITERNPHLLMKSLEGPKDCSFQGPVRPLDTCHNKPVDFPEVVLCWEVYHNKRTTLKTQEFLVLGRQYLTDVRDRIYCLTNEIMDKDVFYNDMREPSAIDYSMPILYWLQNSKNEALEQWESIFSGELQQKQKALLGDENKLRLPLPLLSARHMQHSRFCELTFQIGAGYLYCHQDDCKHVFVIRDMRLIHSEDVQNRAAYPLMTFQTKFRCRKCSVCTGSEGDC